MRVEFISQPDVQFGRILTELLNANPQPHKVIVVSAFVSLQTILRLKEAILRIIESGGITRLVFGIDMGGTSKEVLKEVLSWQTDNRIVKHRRPGFTFHPKLYLVEWQDRAEILVGSNNVTEGGLFRNYESSARIIYDLPNDVDLYETAKQELNRFLDPTGNTTYVLTDDFLNQLVEQGLIPSEAEARRNRNDSISKPGRERPAGEPLFGVEDIEFPPPLPASILEGLVQTVRRRRAQRRTPPQEAPGEITPQISPTDDAITPTSFYMTLPKLQGQNIPGEARIPLEALELAQEFWGWPDEYQRDENPRGGQERVYWNWRPNWRIIDVEHPENAIVQEVRMYFYENSSDFRFYARPLVNAGADLGDLVRITRVSEDDVEFECVLARQGTPEYNAWIGFCVNEVKNSQRKFGYG
jgi:HKD family nuclease